MPKTIVSSNLEVHSDKNATVVCTDHTFGKSFTTKQNVAVYVTWRLSKLEEEHENMLKDICCKVRPRCQNCTLKRRLRFKTNPIKRMGIINEIVYNQYLTEMKKRQLKKKKKRSIKEAVSV